MNETPFTAPQPPRRVGDRYPTWFSGQRDGHSTVLAVSPYTGRYDFTHVLRLTAPRTSRGWLEQAVKLPRREE